MAVGDGKAKGENAKARGNEAFKSGQYVEAVGHYTDAILLDGLNHVYYLNRSMAYMKLNKYEDAERDATASLRLNPNGNVKAYYRRGSARKLLARWGEAKADFEEVVRKDPGNEDAKAEILQLQGKLDTLKKQKSKRPLDVNSLVSSEERRKGEAAKNAGNSSSVEAARKFLEKVDMYDQEGSKKEQPEPTTILERFPGEDGGFLRQVSTRKLVKDNNESLPSTLASLPSASSIVHAQAASESTVKATTDSADVHVKQLQELLSLPSVSPRREDDRAPKRQMSAFEFYRNLRQCSASPDASTKYASQLGLFSSLDLQSVPSMLGSLLEPELLADILDALLHDQDSSHALTLDLLSVLPRCERFEMAWMFLQEQEKQREL
ncbi:hypothetical protein CBS101457_004256 [Exobasidium rhododendri]|nr:hypothetical protein CBS101457_004256 [Exobasidium rhododendri]